MTHWGDTKLPYVIKNMLVPSCCRKARYAYDTIVCACILSIITSKYNLGWVGLGQGLLAIYDICLHLSVFAEATQTIILQWCPLWARWGLKSPASRSDTQPFVPAQIKENIRVTGLCEGNPPVTGGFPSQRASNAKNVPIWWRQHGKWREEIPSPNQQNCSSCVALVWRLLAQSDKAPQYVFIFLSHLNGRQVRSDDWQAFTPPALQYSVHSLRMIKVLI